MMIVPLSADGQKETEITISVNSHITFLSLHAWLHSPKTISSMLVSKNLNKYA